MADLCLLGLRLRLLCSSHFAPWLCWPLVRSCCNFANQSWSGSALSISSFHFSVFWALASGYHGFLVFLFLSMVLRVVVSSQVVLHPGPGSGFHSRPWSQGSRWSGAVPAISGSVSVPGLGRRLPFWKVSPSLSCLRISVIDHCSLNVLSRVLCFVLYGPLFAGGFPCYFCSCASFPSSSSPRDSRGPVHLLRRLLFALGIG